jgi:type IV secretory pathway component VirB8
MKKLLIASAMIVAFATPALAMGPFYIVFDKAAGKCSMVREAPSDTAKFAMMGEYASEKDAHMAMTGMTKCK